MCSLVYVRAELVGEFKVLMHVFCFVLCLRNKTADLIRCQNLIQSRKW